MDFDEWYNVGIDKKYFNKYLKIRQLKMKEAKKILKSTLSKKMKTSLKKIYEDIHDKNIVEDLKKEIYLHEVTYLKMIGVDIDFLENEMDSIVENRIEFIDMIEQYIAIMTDRKMMDSQSKKSNSDSKNRRS
jgi:hypothetical protein